MNIDIWEGVKVDEERHFRPLELGNGQAHQLPPTGPEDLDVTAAITSTLGRLACLLQYQQARLPLMELGAHYTMVDRWTKSTAAEIEALGIGSIGIMTQLKKHGY